jgi:hypothetical protein
MLVLRMLVPGANRGNTLPQLLSVLDDSILRPGLL